MEIKYKIWPEKNGKVLFSKGRDDNIDKNLLSWEGSIGISFLYVNEILTTKSGMQYRCWGLSVNFVYYEL
jgi:hypothetical protein